MPSPLAHAAFGYLFSKFLPLKSLKAPQASQKWEIKYFCPIFIATVADFDFIPQLFTDGNYHRGLTHSLIFTLGISLIVGLVGRKRWQSSFKSVFSLTFLLYSSHLVLDFFGYGRGIKLFAPFSDQFFRSPLIFFPGVHYSRGLFHYSHIFPIGFEIIVFTLLFWGVQKWQNSRSEKPLER